MESLNFRRSIDSAASLRDRVRDRRANLSQGSHQRKEEIHLVLRCAGKSVRIGRIRLGAYQSLADLPLARIRAFQT